MFYFPGHGQCSVCSWKAFKGKYSAVIKCSVLYIFIHSNVTHVLQIFYILTDFFVHLFYLLKRNMYENLQFVYFSFEFWEVLLYIYWDHVIKGITYLKLLLSSWWIELSIIMKYSWLLWGSDYPSCQALEAQEWFPLDTSPFRERYPSKVW